MSAVLVQDLRKTYRVAVKRETGAWAAVKGLFRRETKAVHAVDGISFRIDRGTMVAFLGPNGAGKTTTLKMLSGLIHPSGGSASVLGFVPWERHNEFRRRFALVMGQKNQLWWDLPARESFRLHQEIYAIPPERYRAIHDELVDLLRLGGLIDQPVRELSLGERMKMELVAALLHQPEVLFLDEPTIGLDVVAQNQLRDFLLAHNRKHGVTLILTSHYMRDVESLCDRAIVINHGRLVCDESLEAIIGRFSREKVVRLRFAGEAPEGLERFGPVAERRGPTATLRLARADAPAVLGRLLAEHQLVDVSVDEVPLEEVIAEVFASDPGPAAAEEPSAGAGQ